MCRGAYIPYFKIPPPPSPHFLLLHLFWRMSQPSAQMLNEHKVDYNPIPSEFNSRSHPLIFLWTPKGFKSPEYFLIFLSNLFFTPWLKKMFQIHGVKITRKYICKSNNWICSNLLMPSSKTPPRFLSSLLQAEGNYPFPPNKFFENLFFPSTEGEDYGAENMTKIKLARILVTSFDKFHHLQPLHSWFLFCCTII